MIEQVRIVKGEIYVACDFSYDIDEYEGVPFRDSESNTFQWEYRGASDNGLTNGEEWVRDNIRPEMISDKLSEKLFGGKNGYNPSDYFKK